MSTQGDVDLHDPASGPVACHPIAGVDNQAMQPGVEAIGFADCPDVQPRGDECFLDGISRFVVALEDQPRRAGQPVERHFGERGEGVVVTTPGSQYEVSLHRSSDRSRHDGRLHQS